LSLDPLSNNFPWWSPYQFAGNKPICFIDLDGGEIQIPTFNKFKYGDNVLLNTITVIDNTIINAANGIISTANSGIYTIHRYSTSPSAALSETKSECLAMVNSTLSYLVNEFKYISNTPFKQQLIDTKNAFKSPEAYENALDIAASIILTKRFKSPVISKGVNSVKILKTENILFSQSKVNGLEIIENSMKKNGWKGAPIDVIDLNDGKFGTLDNTRVLAAHNANINVKAIVHSPNELLPADMVKRFTTKKGVPKTWGDAYLLRISNQKSSFRKNNPKGSFSTSSQ
jgi:hypothetical protein